MLYAGERYYTANVHMLLHFADSVRNLGPLWAHSAFPFEDTNGWLGDLFHGTRDPHKQVNRVHMQHVHIIVVKLTLDCEGFFRKTGFKFYCRMRCKQS